MKIISADMCLLYRAMDNIKFVVKRGRKARWNAKYLNNEYALTVEECEGQYHYPLTKINCKPRWMHDNVLDWTNLFSAESIHFAMYGLGLTWDDNMALDTAGYHLFTREESIEYYHGINLERLE